MSYHRPIAPIEIEQHIKKSHFIGNLEIVTSAEQALAYIAQIKAQHRSANHSCHCFIAGSPEQSSAWGYSDDGEPKGTAGQPMFQVLKHSGLGNICVVVTRYFGGIKLGTGGIARAYSSTVNLTLQQCETQLIHLTQDFSLTAPFELTGTIEHLVKQAKGVSIEQRQWLSQGQQLTIRIEEHALESFNQNLSVHLHKLAFCKIK